jgi:hypothetical protein
VHEATTETARIADTVTSAMVRGRAVSFESREERVILGFQACFIRCTSFVSWNLIPIDRSRPTAS